MSVKMNYRDLFVVKPKSEVDLSAVDASFKPSHDTKTSAQPALAQHAQKLSSLQYLLYAENQRSLLVCLQGLDAAGKDGTIRHVLGSVNPQGARVHAFKVPSPLEASHDFLWRAHQQVPAKGEIVVFNRSHYEDVLVVRAHGLVPNRRWKISEADYSERKLWPEYVKAYEEALSTTSTEHAPWFIVPANHKWFRNLAISEILVKTLESFEMKTPPSTVDIADIRRKYHSAESAEKKAEHKEF
jgi:polyphosphate kinase 2 (PPK2 family)